VENNMTAAAPAPAAPATVPGKTLGIISILLTVPLALSLVGLIVGIIARSQSKKAGYSNTPATVGIVLGILGLIGTIIAIILIGAGVAALAAQCAELGSGVHEVGGVTYTCG
jgi:hypothetical protein